jgi:hypothetical protein
MIRIEQGVSKKNNDKNWPTEKLQGRIISVLEGKKKLSEGGGEGRGEGCFNTLARFRLRNSTARL